MLLSIFTLLGYIAAFLHCIMMIILGLFIFGSIIFVPCYIVFFFWRLIFGDKSNMTKEQKQIEKQRQAWKRNIRYMK